MKKMTKAMLMTALICGTMYCGAEPVHANELQEFTLDEYVVTAARTETKLVDTPANISIVTAEQIESRHYTDVAEVLKDVPGATVLDSGSGSTTKAVLLNGDTRVLVLVDGRRVNLDMGVATGAASYDMNQLPDVSIIERIEVLKGASSSLYGSDAVGGVINVITKKGDRSFGKVSLAYGSSGAEDMNALYSFKEKNTGVTVAASKYKQDYYKYKDIKTGKKVRWEEPSDYENEKVSVKIEQNINDDSHLTIGYDYSNMEGSSTGSVIGFYSHGRYDKRTDNVYAKYDWMINENDKGYFQYYHNELDYQADTLLKEKTNGIDVQQTISISDNNKMVVGASWRESDVSNTYSPLYDKTVENFAFFVNDTWEFAPTWSLNGGMRYDDHSVAGDETTFSAGLNKKFNDNSHIYINWGQVFRAPNTDDLYHPSGSNPNLNPETGETWTVGYSSRLNEQTEFGINYFESDIDNAIDWYETDVPYDTNHPEWGYVWAVDNVAKQKSKGIEVNVNHKVNDNLKLQASYTYLQVKNKLADDAFAKDLNVMPNTYRFGVNYNDGKWDSNIWLRAASGGSTFASVDTNGVLRSSYIDSSYVTVDFAITYKADKNWSLFAKGYNLFDESYAQQGGTMNGIYRYPAQSRRFLIGAEYSF